jgi:hypothetical protein
MKSLENFRPRQGRAETAKEVEKSALLSLWCCDGGESNAIVCVLTDSKGHLTRKGYFKSKHKPDRAREAQ